jgi:hypothetical protein
MSADPFSETLAELGRADEVSVAERLKVVATELAALLEELPGDDRQLTDERVAELLDVTSEPAEAFLTVAFPIVEYRQAGWAGRG